MSWPYQGATMIPQSDDPDKGEEYAFEWSSAFWDFPGDDDYDEEEV